MQNILIPTDFSNNAHHAAQYASILANQINANITFLHIFSVPIISEYNLPHEIENFIAKNRIEAVEELKKFVKSFIEESGIAESRVTQRIEYGFIPEKLIDIANELAIDLIIMGTKGASDRFDKWIGTVSQKVVKHSNIPVLIISQKALIHRPKAILYAADFTNDEVVATEKLLKIADKFEAECSLVHIHEKFEPNVGHQIEAMASYLEDTFEKDGLRVKILQRDDTIEALEQYVTYKKPDILAISIHEKSIFDTWFLPSVSKHFLQEAKLPILCFRK